MANAGGWLAVLGGLIILISGLMLFAAPTSIPSLYTSYVSGSAGAGLAVISGLLVLVGGWMTSKSGSSTGAVLAVLFSLIAFAVGGGWVIGSILGLIGGIWGFMKK